VDFTSYMNIVAENSSRNNVVVEIVILFFCFFVNCSGSTLGREIQLVTCRMAACKSIGTRSRREVETVSFRPSVSIRHSRLVNVSPPLDNKMNYTKKELNPGFGYSVRIVAITSKRTWSNWMWRQWGGDKRKILSKESSLYPSVSLIRLEENFFSILCNRCSVHNNSLLLHIKYRWILWIPHQKQKGKKKWNKNYILIWKQRFN